MEGGMLILTANGVRAAKLEDRVVKGFHFRNGELRIISGKLGSPEDREEEEDAQPQTQASSHASRPASLDSSRSEPSLSEQIPAQESSLASRKPQDTITQTSTAGDYVSANIQRASSSSYTGEKQQSNTFYINNTKTDAPAPSPAKPPAEEHLDTLQKLKKLRSDLAATPPAFTAENTSGVPPFLKEPEPSEEEPAPADALREPQGYPREGLAATSLSAEISTAALDNPAVNEDVQKIKALADYSSKIEPEIKGLLKQAGEEAANVEAVERLTQLSNDIAGQLEDTQGWNKEMHETNAAAVRNALLVELKTLQQLLDIIAGGEAEVETLPFSLPDWLFLKEPEIVSQPSGEDEGTSPRPSPKAKEVLETLRTQPKDTLPPVDTTTSVKPPAFIQNRPPVPTVPKLDINEAQVEANSVKKEVSKVEPGEIERGYRERYQESLIPGGKALINIKEENTEIKQQAKAKIAEKERREAEKIPTTDLRETAGIATATSPIQEPPISPQLIAPVIAPEPQENIVKATAEDIKEGYDKQYKQGIAVSNPPAGVPADRPLSATGEMEKVPQAIPGLGLSQEANNILFEIKRDMGIDGPDRMKIYMQPGTNERNRLEKSIQELPPKDQEMIIKVLDIIAGGKAEVKADEQALPEWLFLAESKPPLALPDWLFLKEPEGKPAEGPEPKITDGITEEQAPTETPVAMTSDQIHPAAQPELPPLPPTRNDGVSPQPPPAASGILQEPGSRFNEALLPINTSAPAKLSTTDTQVNPVTSPISPEEGAAKEPTTTGAAAPPPLAAAIDTKPPASAQPSTFQEQVPVQESGLKPWQMRAEVYAAPDANTSFEEAQRRLQGHRGLVREALARGENVPLEVLAAYPDLTNESSATTKHDQPVNRENPWWDYGDAYKEMVNPLRLSLATSKATAEDIKEGYDKQYEREIAVSDAALKEIQRQNAELAAMQARQLPNPPPAPPERSFLQRLFGGGGKKITVQPTTAIETTAEKSAQNPPKSGFLNKPISRRQVMKLGAAAAVGIASGTATVKATEAVAKYLEQPTMVLENDIQLAPATSTPPPTASATAASTQTPTPTATATKPAPSPTKTSTSTPSPIPSPTETPPPTAESKPIETKDTLEQEASTVTPEAEKPPKNIFKELVLPKLKEFVKKRRLEKQQKDPEYLSRISPELNKDRINFLLMGIGKENALTDSILVGSYHEPSHTLSLISLPRDLQSPEVLKATGNPAISRINQAFAYGGMDLAGYVIENATGLSVDFTVVNKFDALIDLVNHTTGYIDIELKEDIDDPRYPAMEGHGYDPFHIKAGTWRVKGDTALKIARSRQGSKGGDYDRAGRQQKVFDALLKTWADVGKKDVLSGAGLVGRIKKVIEQKLVNKSLQLDFAVEQILWPQIQQVTGAAPQIFFDHQKGQEWEFGEKPQTSSLVISNKNFVASAEIPGVAITKIKGGNPYAANVREGYWKPVRQTVEQMLMHSSVKIEQLSQDVSERILSPQELSYDETKKYLGRLQGTHDSVLSESLFTQELASLPKPEREKTMQTLARAHARAVIEQYGDSEAIIGLDPGHGQTDIGSSGKTPEGEILVEKDITWQLAQMTAQEIYKQSNGEYYVVILRPEVPNDNDINHDGTISPVERLQKRKALLVKTEEELREDPLTRGKEIVYLSLHFNGHPDPKTRGTEVYWPNKVGEPDASHRDSSMALAQRLQRTILEELKQVGYTSYDRGAKEDPDQGDARYSSHAVGPYVVLGGKMGRDWDLTRR